MSSEELRPLSVGEILSTALRIYGMRFGLLVRLVAFILPVEVLYAIASSSAASDQQDRVASFLSGVLLVVTGQLAAAACLKAVSDTYLGAPTSWRSSVEFVARRLGSVIAVSILTAVLVGIGLVLLVVPGLYLDVVFLVATPALLIEGLRPFQALGRSRQLVTGAWWRTFGAYLLAAIFVGVVALIPTLLLVHSTGVGAHTTAGRSVLSAVIASVTSLLTTPFMASVVVLLYYDLRVRKEGLDVAGLARGVGIEHDLVDRSRYAEPEEPPYPDR